MKAKDQFRTGWRNLSRQKLRTTLTIFAIVIGAVSVTVMLSLVTSAKSFLTDSYTKTGEIKRVIVTNQRNLSYRDAKWSNSDGTGVKLTDDVVAKVSTIDRVNSVSPVLTGGGFNEAIVNGKTESVKNSGMFGFVPNGTIHWEVLTGRELEAADAGKGAVVTRPMANALGYRGNYEGLIGQTVTFTASYSNSPEQIQMPVEIVGVVASEDRLVLIDLDLASRTFSKPGQEQYEEQKNV